jgi:signal transduction histidine kinase
MVSAQVQDPPARFLGPYLRILETLCGPADFREAARTVLRQAAAAAGCEAAGLRVRDSRGDFPYFVYQGFDQSFLEKERSLCRMGAGGRAERSGAGELVLECVCGLVVAGRTDPAQPFFTAGGSFWTNSSSRLLDSGAVPREAVRGTCVARGFESVGLFPLRARDEIVGLLQVNSRLPGRFDPETVGFLERVAGMIGGAVAAAWSREDLSRLRREFEETRRGAVSLMAMSEMASSLAHEVKNPLASMMLSANRLKRLAGGSEKLAPLAEHLCAAIQSLGETVTRITESLGQPRLELAPVSVNEVLEAATYLLAPRAASQKVRIVRELDERLPAASADANFLKRAFLNVLVNALDAMPAGGLLRVASRQAAPGELEVLVADTGPGLDPKVADRLFKPFVTTRADGTGLGLSIVRRIMELHRGSAELRPGSAGGAEAVLRLPAAGPGKP